MEIVVNNVTYKACKNMSFKVTDKYITAFTGDNAKIVLELLTGKVSYTGTILYDGLKPNSKNNILKSISYIDKEFINIYEKDTIIDYMKYHIYSENLSIKNIEKKIMDSLKIVGLDTNYIDKEIDTLSKSELKLFQIALGLLNNPKLILLNDVFSVFDVKNVKKLCRLFNKLSEKYHINIIVTSDSSDFIYKYIKEVFIFKKGKIVASGISKDVYEDLENLKDNNLEIPKILLFTSKIKEKGVKIDYHRDVRDLIKDIYKHV